MHESQMLKTESQNECRFEICELLVDRLIRSAGGTWNIEKKYWELQYRKVIALGFENRIITN